MRVVSQAFGPREPGKILDIGCGDGSFLMAAKRKGWEAIGTELNAKDLQNTSVTVFETTEEARHHGPFACITLWHSLEHFSDPLIALRDLRVMLVPEGILMIVVPNAGGLQSRLFGRHWLADDVPRHLQHFSIVIGSHSESEWIHFEANVASRGGVRRFRLNT
jgi:2-polyprenyl-3-methyl-5-hydroxy-6-metoxy-1,4-benzoquinol methylase